MVGIKDEHNLLICTVGLPRSGKSTWARAYSKQRGVPIVCPDSFRYAVYGQRFWGDGEALMHAHVNVAIRALFHAGNRWIILDECNVSRKRRNARLCPQDSDIRWETKFKLIRTDVQVCLERARAENDAAIEPVILRMAGEIEYLNLNEEQEFIC